MEPIIVNNEQFKEESNAYDELKALLKNADSRVNVPIPLLKTVLINRYNEETSFNDKRLQSREKNAKGSAVKTFSATLTLDELRKIDNFHEFLNDPEVASDQDLLKSFNRYKNVPYLNMDQEDIIALSYLAQQTDKEVVTTNRDGETVIVFEDKLGRGK